MRSRWTAVLVAVVAGAMLVLGPSGAASATATGTEGAMVAPAASPWVAVSLGKDSFVTCAVRADHTGWCWGLADLGSLGIGILPIKVAHPVQVPGDWNSITVESFTTCGIKTDSTGWCWGWNREGQVGSGGSTRQASPFQLPGHWQTIAPGGDTSCGVQTDGTGWCWGGGARGQIGDGHLSSRLTPTQVPGTWSAISSHFGTTCGVRVDGTGWCWGSNDDGRVGDGTLTLRPSPTQLPGLWSSISTRYSNTCGIQVDQGGWCWGANFSGMVGDGTTVRRLTPVELPGRWTDVQPADSNTCGVTTDGKGWCWGDQRFGQVGNGVISFGSPRLTPHALPGGAGSWASVQATRLATCGLKTDGAVLCWGLNQLGELGAGIANVKAIRATPQRVRPFLSWTRLATRIGGAGGCALRANGTLWCWGDNRYGELGDGTTITRDHPVLVKST
ncbi:MAG: hypothetical protein ABI083_13170 [Lapillicoccus sp.]